MRRGRLSIEEVDRKFAGEMESRLIGVGAAMALLGTLVLGSYWLGHRQGVEAGARDGQIALEEMGRLRATNLVDAGWLEGHGDYRRLSIDSGRTWYAFDFDTAGRPVILGDLRAVQPALAARLTAMDAMLSHAARRRVGAPLAEEERAILEAAGFGMQPGPMTGPGGNQPDSAQRGRP